MLKTCKMNLIPMEAHMEFVTLTILVPRFIVNYNGSGAIYTLTKI